MFATEKEFQMDDKQKKTVVITGGTGGIGTEMAKTMAKRGHRVVLTYVVEDEKQQTEELLADIQQQTGCEGMALYTDVTDYEQCEQLAKKTADEYGTIDVLVNNAGIFCEDTAFHKMDTEQMDNTLDVNLKGVLYCTRATLPYMLKQDQGCIVNTASIAGMDPSPNNAEYSASKAGVIGFTRSIAAGYADNNIRCNAIAPGIIETPMTEGRLADEIDTIPMGRVGKPEEIADALDYIVHADYLTGQTISPNGGMVMP